MPDRVHGLGTVIYRVTDLGRAKTWYSTAFQQQPYFDEPFYVGFNIGGYELGLNPDTTGATREREFERAFDVAMKYIPSARR